MCDFDNVRFPPDADIRRDGRSLEFTPNGEPLPDKLGRGAPEGEALGS